jgi:hypothetical protein
MAARLVTSLRRILRLRIANRDILSQQPYPDFSATDSASWRRLLRRNYVIVSMFLMLLNNVGEHVLY